MRGFLFFVLVGASLPAGAQTLELQLHTFPEDAQAALISGVPGAPAELLRPDEEDGAWRVYRNVPAGGIIELRSAGFISRRIHLPNPDRVVRLEERLLPATGPLHLVAEAPTGGSPKSVTFLSSERLAVPLLRDGGIDTYRITRDRWGNAGLTRDGRLEPPSEWAADDGFVEPLLLPRTGELWVSQMTAAYLHRFEAATGRWVSAHPSGGGWPKVIVADRAEEVLYVSNWQGEAVSRIDRTTGTITATIPVGGEPRGLLLSDNDRALWVCIFSSGEVVRVDTATLQVTDRFGPAVGAARHIIASSSGGALYYSDMYHGTVNIIDPEKRRVVRTRRVGTNINTIAIDPAGRYLYVSERGRNNRESYLLPGPEFGRILVLDPQTLETVQEIYGRHQPTGLAVSPDGRWVAATDFLDDNVALYRVTQ